MTVRTALVLNNGQVEQQQSGDLISGVANVLTNTTLYVATTGNDTTGDGSIGNPWLTIGKALSYLTDKWIDKGSFVTIQVGDGNFAISTTLTVNHPHGDRLSLVGTNTHDKTLSSVQSSSGSAGAWSYILNVNTVTDLAVDDYVLIRAPANGTRPTHLAGCHQITNVDAINSRITIAVKHKHASAASGAVTGTVTCVKTRITVTGTDGLVVVPTCSLSFVDKIIMAGDATAGKTGFLLTYGTAASSGGAIAFGNGVGSVNFTYGVQCVGGSVIGGIVCSGHLASGIQLFNGGKLYASLGVVCSGNGAFGVFATLNSSAYCPASICTGNSDSGFGASVKGSISGSSSTLTANTLNGAVAEVGGTILVDLSTITTNLDNGVLVLSDSNATCSSATISSNGTYGIYVQHGYVQSLGSTVSGNGTASYNIPVDKLDLYDSYIDTGAVTYDDAFVAPGGRLTLESGVPVSSSDQALKTTVYYTPYLHNRVRLKKDGVWQMVTFTERSGTPNNGAALPQDVFLYDNSGTLTLEFVNWSSATARSTAISFDTTGGFYVKSGNDTRLYLGTVKSDSTSHVSDTQRLRLVWNMYNRVQREFYWAGPGTNWTYSSSSVFRYVNAGSAPSVALVVGLVDTFLRLMVHVTASRSIGTGSGAAVISIGIDSTTVAVFHVQSAYIRETDANGTSQNAFYTGIVPLGYHEYNWIERTASTSQTLNCTGTNGDEAGFTGSVMS